MWAGCKDASPRPSCCQYVNTPAGWPCWGGLFGFRCFLFFFLKAAWADLTQQQRSWEIWASVRFVSQLRWKFFGCWIFLFFYFFLFLIIFACVCLRCAFRLKSSSLQCLPLSGMPRSWDAGLCITPGKQKQRRYVPSGNIKPYVSCRLPAGILLCICSVFLIPWKSIYCYSWFHARILHYFAYELLNAEEKSFQKTLCSFFHFFFFLQDKQL